MRCMDALTQSCLAGALMSCTLVGDLGAPASTNELGEAEAGGDEPAGDEPGEASPEANDDETTSDDAGVMHDATPPADLGDPQALDDGTDASCLHDCPALPAGSIVISEITGSSNPESGGWIELAWAPTFGGCMLEGLELQLVSDHGGTEQIFELPPIPMLHERAIVGDRDSWIGADVPSDQSVEVGGLLVPATYQRVLLRCHAPTSPILDVVDGRLVTPGMTMSLDDFVEFDLAAQNDDIAHWCARPGTPALPNGPCPEGGTGSSSGDRGGE